MLDRRRFTGGEEANRFLGSLEFIAMMKQVRTSQRLVLTRATADES